MLQRDRIYLAVETPEKDSWSRSPDRRPSWIGSGIGIAILVAVGSACPGHTQIAPVPPTAPNALSFGTPAAYGSWQGLPVQPTSPTSPQAIITDLQVRFLDDQGQPADGTTRPFIITREFDIQPGDPYDPVKVQQGLARVLSLDSIRTADIAFAPTEQSDRVVMIVSVVERNSFVATMSLANPAPSALYGPFQPRSVEPGIQAEGGLAAGGTVGIRNLGGNDQDVLLRAQVGETAVGAEVSFTDPWIATDSQRTGYRFNFFNQRAIQSSFEGGNREVDTPGGETPWIDRLGGGAEVFRPLGTNWTGVAGVSYQRVAVRDAAFSTGLTPRDERGNPLTVSPSGQDDLLTLRLATDFDRRNDLADPTDGTRLQLGLEQAIPVGDANINFTRLTANYLEYIPTQVFDPDSGAETLVLNLQAGTMFGDVPPYEAFDLDAGPVHGYGGLDIGTGSSFAAIATEYRFPIANFFLADSNIQLGGALFAGYVTDLGTADEVIGQPAVVRDKPGDSFTYGVGLRANTPMGLFRVEWGFDDVGNEVVVTTGERF